MLRDLRQRTKTILWIVVLTFVISIFAVWGMDLQGPKQRKFDANIVGNVDKQAISQQAYNDVLNQLYNQVKIQKGENYTPSDMERSLLADQAWEYAVQARLMQREIDKLHIQVSDAELVSFLRQNPHPSLQAMFKTEDGQFDYQAYLKALSDPDADWTELERWGRAAIPEIKLQTYLVSQIHIPENEALERFKDQNLAMKARYVQIPIQKAEGAPYEPTDAELRGLYEQRKADFKAPAMRRVRVMEIEKKPTAADEEDIKARAEDIRADIAKGTLDFAEAAKEYSDDNTTADKGGDLGFFKKGDMAPEFDAAAFALKPGQLSEPVRTPFGYHLIKVEERKTEKGIETIHARHILMKVEPGTDTVDSLQLVLRDISTEIHDKGFEKTAADRKLKTFDTEPFAQGMFIKDLGFAPRVASFAFNYGEGSVSYGIDGETSIRFVKVIEALPEQEKTFEQVRPQLVDELRVNREADAARAVAESLRKEILSGGSFDAVAKAKGFAVKETPSFKVGDAIPEIGTNTPFQTACKFLAVNAVSPPIKGQGRYYLIKIVERTEPDMAKYVEARQGIVSEMRNEVANRFMASWYQDIRDNAKVEDLREKPLQ
ncbi:MAG: peptidyl-prolyl cis-trans isomerase [Candidatus Krumholzibacteria bacterium]|nr:peptidyl-prolyl cis-trans isomerase [Candidatus Krumholzibacteria bacterium]